VKRSQDHVIGFVCVASSPPKGIASHLPRHPDLPSLPSHPFLSQGTMILPGFTNSKTVSVSVEPNTPLSTITLSSAHRLQLLPLFNHLGRYACDVVLSVPTRGGSYTSHVSLGCSHTPGGAEIALGSDWISACSATLSDDGSGLEDPGLSIISSLPAGHYWTPSNGTTIVY